MLKEEQLNIDYSCHVIYSKEAKNAILKLVKEHYPDSWEDVFEKIQRRYEAYLKNYRQDLGGAKNFHNGLGGTYDCIFYFCLWEVCKADISFEELEQNYAEIMLPSFQKLKLFNGNHRIVHRMMYLVFKNAKKRCDAFGDYNMHINPYDKEQPLTYHFTSCPTAEFARENGFTDILPALCNVDYACMECIHMKLIRTKTLGFADCCDYRIVGDQDPLVQQHPEYRDENGYIRNK